MEVWMEVSKDDLKLPLAVANSCAELSRITGAREDNIRSAASYSKRYGIERRFIKVEVEDEE